MASRRQFVEAALGGAAAFRTSLLSIFSAAPNGDPQSKKTTLTPNKENNSFDFETEQIEGSIRLDGVYHGVTRLTDKRTGRQLIDSRYSALNLFFLFSVNQLMGQPRQMQRTTKISPEAVEVTWPATGAHKGEVTARYEVIEPNAVELTVTVRTQATYAGYEVLLPSYFDKVLRPYIYVLRRGGTEPDLIVPSVNDVFRGMLLAFPRDVHAARRRMDGRWDRIFPMCVARPYAYCVAFATDPEKKLAVVLLAHPRQSGAINVRYFADNDADRLTSYTAFDFSLFDEDLSAGDERTAKVRLVLTPLDDKMSQPLKLYRAFIAEIDDQLRGSPVSPSKGK